MEYGEGPIGECNQHTTFHMPAIREETETAEKTSDSKVPTRKHLPTM